MFDDAVGSDATNSNGNGKGQADGEGGTTQTALTFDTWQSSLPDEQKSLIESHTKGLKSALEAERGSRKDLEKQVRELAAKAEKGSDAERQLTELANKIQESDRRADFFDAAHRAGVTNLKLAYLTATMEDLFDRKGNADFEAMKKQFPELFGVRKSPAGNAGEGTDGGTPAPADMNARIRRLAGRT
jgi:hypothetical protein